MLLRSFSLLQKNQISHVISGKAWLVGKQVIFFLKVIDQGQGHNETFSKESKVENIYQSYSAAIGIHGSPLIANQNVLDFKVLTSSRSKLAMTLK